MTNEETNKIICHKIDCKNEAEYGICLALSPDGIHFANSTPILLVCKDHMDVTFAQLTPENQWQGILKTFKEAGKMPPKRKFSRLEFVKLPKID